VRISDNDGLTNAHLPFGAPATGGINFLHELRVLRSFRYDGLITLEITGERRWLTVSGEVLRELWSKAQ